MNYVTQSFQDFSSSLGPTDLALYAGAAVVIWVLFKEKLSPVQKLVMNVLGKVKGLVPSKLSTTSEKDLFFKLVQSWKQTRDLAVQSGCGEAVKVADQMFPYLSPTVCSNKDEKATS